ncbi:stomatin-like protein 1 [Meriones unguiculatus]|uniref:stomatin-like protein 1 n=1 Tax=Meriones unguiculatus TaxID=10047 RepID=UPI00293F6F23|nr:stomatin-like protein 1 [Meriones unguiculatus]
MVVFRLGPICTPTRACMVLFLPFIDSFQRVDLRTEAFSVPPCKLDGMTRVWGLEVDRIELAVEAVLQPPQDSPAVSSLKSTLQQRTLQQPTLHLLGGSMNSVVGGVLSLGPVDTLAVISEVEPSASHAVTEHSLKWPVAEELLTALQPFLSEELVNQVGVCYQFNVLLPRSTQSTYFQDLTTGQGRVGHGVPDGIPDMVVEIAEAVLQALLCRELRPLGTYMSGWLKVKGDLAIVMKLEAILKALK